MDEQRLQTRLVTVSEAPGYRDVALIMDVTDDTGRTRRVRLHLRPEDAGPIVAHLRHVHRLAWSGNDGPIDKLPGETRPHWID